MNQYFITYRTDYNSPTYEQFIDCNIGISAKDTEMNVKYTLGKKINLEPQFIMIKTISKIN